MKESFWIIRLISVSLILYMLLFKRDWIILSLVFFFVTILVYIIYIFIRYGWEGLLYEGYP